MLVVWALSGASGIPLLQAQGTRRARWTSRTPAERPSRTHRVQVDYGQFFPFAFFFTILHVVTLVVATSPARTLQSVGIAIIYVLGALLGLFILFRR